MPVTENLRKGMRAARAGRKTEAIAAFQSALDQDPINETALLWLGYLADDPQVSLAHITKAMELHVQSPRAYEALQWAWQRAAAVPAGMVSGGSGTLAIPRPVHAPVPTRHRQVPQAMTRLPTLGILFLVVAVISGVLGFPLLSKPPTIAALASAFNTAPQPMVAVDVSTSSGAPAWSVLASTPLDSPLPTVADLPSPSATPTLTPNPTDTPLPTFTPSSTPSPVPTPSLTPTPVPVGLVVPEPFPIPGPQAYVPSTTLMIPTPVQPVPVAADAVNIVVLGSDRREDWSEWHTDVVQVVSVQRGSGTVSIISVPRDLYVYIPTLWMSRINFADFYGDAYGYEGGGPALLRDTLLYNLGIRMDYYVRTDFDGLIGIVNTAGGVDIPVHCRLSDHWPYPDENGEYPILTMEPGVHHMDGETALWYARSRLTTSVLSRERRQQQVLYALWSKARGAGMLTQAPALWSQGQDMIKTDLILTDILELAQIAISLDDRSVRFYNIGAGAITPWTTPYGGSVFLPRWEEIQPIVAEAMAPPPEARLSRVYMPIEVWNGAPNEGWGWLAVDRLYRLGFPAEIGEADRQDYAETRLLIFNESVKGTGAGYLQQVFNISDSQVIHRPDESSAFGFRLILGTDYQTCPQE
jgi:LCP family protein required for cell wall assembly